MKSIWLVPAVLLIVLIMDAPRPARGANFWTHLHMQFGRYFQTGATYGCDPHRGYQDCQMPWQPIQSSMHPVVLPPGMLRAHPIYRPSPSLAPRTPSWYVRPHRHVVPPHHTH